MPAFPWVSNDELQAVVDYVILLSQRGELERFLVVEAEEYPADEPLEDALIEELEQQVVQSWSPEETPQVIPRTAMPLMTDETIELGRQAFLSRGCAKCHGEDGRGHTQENVGKDAWGNTVKAADLTSGMLRGGRRPLDVYLRIQTGINGTPMPDFATALAEEPETTWHLAHYILHLANRKGTASPPGNTQEGGAAGGAAGPGAARDGTQGGATQSDGTAQQ
jgi:mono/diheme cytochrome c family protein